VRAAQPDKAPLPPAVAADVCRRRIAQNSHYARHSRAEGVRRGMRQRTQRGARDAQTRSSARRVRRDVWCLYAHADAARWRRARANIAAMTPRVPAFFFLSIAFIFTDFHLLRFFRRVA
jgi:hypothetical protein